MPAVPACRKRGRKAALTRWTMVPGLFLRVTHPIAQLHPRGYFRAVQTLFGEGEHARIHTGAHMRDVIRNQAIDFKQGDAANEHYPARADQASLIASSS
jgi:hypothetical protein